MEKLIDEIKKSNNGKVLGIFAKDNHSGPFVESWKNALKKHDFENVCGQNMINQEIACFPSILQLCYHVTLVSG